MQRDVPSDDPVNGSLSVAAGTAMTASFMVDERRHSPETRERIDADVRHLVLAAVGSEDVAGPLAVLAEALDARLAVLDRDGLLLAHAPADDECACALRTAGVVDGQADDAARAELRSFPLGVGTESLGSLVIVRNSGLSDREMALIEIAVAVLAQQLQRTGLAREALADRQRELKRRLVSESRLVADALQSDAELAGVRLADYYWPVILYWEAVDLESDAEVGVEAVARRHAPQSLAILCESRSLFLLLAQPCAGPEHEFDARFAVEQVVTYLQRRVLGLRVHGVLADASVALPGLPASLRRLEHLCHQAALDFGRAAVLPARRFAVQSLLEGIDRGRAAQFVASQIGPLLAYDRAHKTSLAETLEIALDSPNRDAAARASYMHRNTFRRHLQRALDLLSFDVENAHERLAVHLALKLKNVLEAPGAGPVDAVTKSLADTGGHPTARRFPAGRKRGPRSGFSAAERSASTRVA